MAAPQFKGVGATISGIGAITVPWPATHDPNDVALLFVESANELVTLTTPAGFAAVADSPQGIGTGGAVAATRLSVFWCRASSSAQASPVVGDSGARQTAFIMTFSGCITSGDPWDVTAGDTAASATAVSIPGDTTTVAETLVVLAVSNAAGVAAPMVRPDFANASLTNLVKRHSTQPDGVGGGGSTDNFLRVGVFTSRDPGVGPGNDFVGEPWRILKRVPSPTNINAMIDDADTHDVLLLLQLTGAKSNYRDAAGNFSLALFEQRLDRFVGNTKLQDAFNRRRAIHYVLDEPNLNNEITPTQVNQCAAACKARWPGSLTFVRAAPSTLRNGWGGSGAQSSATYGKVDYAWSQYNTNKVLAGETPAQVLVNERAIAGLLNVGVAVSLNLWAGGISSNLDGVTACWNTNGAGGNFGYILGDREGALEGTFVACGNLGTPVPSVIASPAWIQHFVDVITADTLAPFCIFWEDAETPSSSEAFTSIWLRADYVAALNYALTKGATRTQWVGWRTAK